MNSLTTELSINLYNNFSIEENKSMDDEFSNAFSKHFNKNDSLFTSSSNSGEENEYNNLDNKEINCYNTNIWLGKKTERNPKFKVEKINYKREIAFTTFNTKFNKYLTEKVNKKILENFQISKTFFNDENPLLSTRFTQCGIQKTLKGYLNMPLKEFIKEENLLKIKEIGLEKDSLFNSLINELIYEYYEFIYSNQEEFNKYLWDNKFVIRNEKFSKEGLINLKFRENSKKVFGYLDFFHDMRRIKSKRKSKPLFKICLKG